MLHDNDRFWFLAFHLSPSKHSISYKQRFCCDRPRRLVSSRTNNLGGRDDQVSPLKIRCSLSGSIADSISAKSWNTLTERLQAKKKHTKQIYFQRTKYFFILLSAMHQFQLVMHCCCGRCSRSFTLVLLLLLRGLIISGLESFLVICQLRNFENYKGRKFRKFENCQEKNFECSKIIRFR